MLLAASCASDVNLRTFHLDLRWRTSPDEPRRQLTLGNDGIGMLRTTRRVAGVPASEAPRHFVLDDKQLAKLKEPLSLCLKLPRAAHALDAGPGVTVTLVMTHGEATLQHESTDAFDPGLVAFARALCDALPEFAEPLEPLLGLAAEEHARTWRLPRDGDPVPALRLALCPPSASPGVVQLASKLAIELAAHDLVPCLHEQFASGTTDPRLACTLLLLGDRIGVARVIESALAIEPEQALFAISALNAAFAQAYGRPPLSGHDFLGNRDARPAAAARLRAWLDTSGDTLHFVPATRSYHLER